MVVAVVDTALMAVQGGELVVRDRMYLVDMGVREYRLMLLDNYLYKDISKEEIGYHLDQDMGVVEFLDVLLETTGFSKDSLHVRIWERFSGVVLMEMRLVVVQLLLEDINQE